MMANDVLKLLGVTKMTLHNWVKSGQLKILGRVGRHIVYDDESVAKLITERKIDRCSPCVVFLYGDGRHPEMINTDLKTIDKIRTAFN